MVDYVKRILVTGGCGFIGNHFLRKLVKEHKDWLITNMCTFGLFGEFQQDKVWEAFI